MKYAFLLSEVLQDPLFQDGGKVMMVSGPCASTVPECQDLVRMMIDACFTIIPGRLSFYPD